MQQLITDLLAYSRLNTRPAEPKRVSTAMAIRNVLIDLGPAIRESATEIECDDVPDEHATRATVPEPDIERDQIPSRIRAADQEHGTARRCRLAILGVRQRNCCLRVAERRRI